MLGDSGSPVFGLVGGVGVNQDGACLAILNDGEFRQNALVFVVQNNTDHPEAGSFTQLGMSRMAPTWTSAGVSFPAGLTA